MDLLKHVPIIVYEQWLVVSEQETAFQEINCGQPADLLTCIMCAITHNTMMIH